MCFKDPIGQYLKGSFFKRLGTTQIVLVHAQMESDPKILNFDSSILNFSSCLTEHLEFKYNPFTEAKKIESFEKYF